MNNKRRPVDEPRQSTLCLAGSQLACRTDRVNGTNAQQRITGFFKRPRTLPTPDGVVQQPPVMAWPQEPVQQQPQVVAWPPEPQLQGVIRQPGHQSAHEALYRSAVSSLLTQPPRLQPPRPRLPPRMPQEPIHVIIEPPSQDCVICQDQPREHALLPCLHRCLCPNCAALLCAHANPVCPLCRAPVTSHGKVYD